MNYEDEILPGSHRRRYAKVTMYLEVPSKLDADSLEREIEKAIRPFGMYTTSYMDIIMSKPGSDDFRKYENPVGFLAPDGRFYLIEAKETGLAHLELAPFVYELYKDQIDDRLFRSAGTLGIDFALERVGFIKVHGLDIRGLAHFPAIWDWNDTNDENTIYTPDPTQAQIDILVEYIKIHGYKNEVSINDHNVSASMLAQADKFAIRKMFEI